VNSCLLSLRINEYRNKDAPGEIKILAYLLDQQTICIKDLIRSVMSVVHHGVTIDFLELNDSGTMLLFRDTHHVLYLFNIRTQTRTTLLPYCGYVQWVLSSDVVVAQNKSIMCVWYNLSTPDQVRNIDNVVCSDVIFSWIKQIHSVYFEYLQYTTLVGDDP